MPKPKAFITRAQFDQKKPQILKELEKWFEAECQDFDSAVIGTSPIFDDMPEIDSKAVVRASPIVEAHTGLEIKPQWVRKGGYTSFEDLANDLLPQIRQACPEEPGKISPPKTPSKSKYSEVGINARRR